MSRKCNCTRSWGYNESVINFAQRVLLKRAVGRPSLCLFSTHWWELQPQRQKMPACCWGEAPGRPHGRANSLISSLPVFPSFPCSPIRLITEEERRGQPVEHAQAPRTRERTVPQEVSSLSGVNIQSLPHRGAWVHAQVCACEGGGAYWCA